MFNNLKQLTKKMLSSASLTYTPTDITAYNSNNSEDMLESLLQTNNYQNSLYLQKGLAVIKDAVSAVDLELFKIINTKGESENVEVHPILTLLDNPNPLQSRLEFMRITVVNYKLSGEFFWRIIKDEAGNPVGLLNINPNNVTVRLNDKAEVIYNIATEAYIDYTSADIIHGKDPTPNNPLRGTGVLKTVASRIITETTAIDYQNGRFLRNDTPDGILVYKSSVESQEKLNELKRSFFNSFRGINDKNRTAVITGDVDYKQLATNSNNLNFIEIQKQVRDDILMALGIPKSMITTDDVNRANAEAGLEQFNRNTLLPMMQIIVEAINEKFIIPYYGQEYYLELENLFTEDKESLLKELDITVNGRNQVLTVNEMRDRLGYEPIEGGDELNQAQASIFNTNSGSQLQNNSLKGKKFIKSFIGRRELYKSLKENEELARNVQKVAIKSVLSSKKFRVSYIKALEDVRNRGESLITAEMKVLLNEQLAKALKRLKAGSETANGIFSRKEEVKASKELIMPLYNKISNLSAQVALSPVKAFKKDANFVMSERLAKKLNKRATLFATRVTDTTFSTVDDIVTEYMHEGADKVAVRLTEAFAGMSDGRAYTIARTEATHVSNLASEEAYKQSDAVSGKEWLTTGDGLVRDEHVINDGQVVDKDGVFNNGESYPGEETINCRCALAPVIDINNLF